MWTPACREYHDRRERANPFAVSRADSVGIMQIHLPTWGRIAEKEEHQPLQNRGQRRFRRPDPPRLHCRHGSVGRCYALPWMDRQTPNPSKAPLEYVQKVQRIYEAAPKTSPSEPTQAFNLG